ncbi:beta-glucuronidase [soil metagenome]
MSSSKARKHAGKFLRSILIAAFACAATALAQSSGKTDLSGQWRFALDPSNQGVTGNWFDQSLKDKIALPGVLQSQGFGNDVSTKTPWVLSLYDHYWFDREDYKDYTKPGNTKVPFLSQPPKHYIGAAWYQRDIVIPANWSGKRAALYLERPHWESTIWLDDKKIGSARSLVAPHEFDLGIAAPGKHRLTIRVDNGMILTYRLDAHSVSDSLGMSWNGIVGKIELRATNPVWIDDAQVYPDVETKTATVKVKFGNISGKSGSGDLTANGVKSKVTWTEFGGEAEIKVQFPKTAQTWDEFHPVLQKIALQLSGSGSSDSRGLSFGFANIKADGKKLVLNGREVYFRGTHHGGDFPLTGYPPTDLAYWRKILQINKDWGINHIRFHSFCPPEAAFQAADELGIYLQPEPGTWNEISPGTPLEKMLYEETEAMIRAYGNHPSYVMLSPSNEPKGRWKESFDKWIAHYRIADPRRLYNNGTGHTEPSVPGLAEGTDFITMQRVATAMLRGNSAWFGRDYRASLDEVNIPVLSHELGQWIAYPDYDIIKKFTGYMRPGNYEIFRDSLAAKGLLAKDKEFAYTSGRYQLECYKEEIEANLRTPGMSGFQLLDLHDYLGQGTALVGILDAFWEPKGYATAKEFRRFNSETVPLARINKLVMATNEELNADVEIAHFGEKPLPNAASYWKIVDEKGAVVTGGDFPKRAIPIGKNISLGKVAVSLSKLAAPKSYKLVVGITGTTIENDWQFWVYPERPTNLSLSNISITHSWDEAEAKLAQGAKVLYMPRKADLGWTSPPLDWVPVFWNRLMNPAWGRMLGLSIAKEHPALAEFPTDSYYNWQWSSIVTGSRAINLDRLPKDLQPIVQPIDDWNRNYKLGLIFEAKVGSGKLLVSAPDLENSLDRRIAARQLRRSLLDYMASSKFDPKVEVTTANFREVLFDTRIMKKLQASISRSPSASQAIDGDPNTYWTGGDPRLKEERPFKLDIDFFKPRSFSGLMIMPRQNHREHEGDVREYSIQISDDGKTWSELKTGSLKSTFDPQQIDFGKSITTRYLRFVALSGFGVDKIAAIAELAVIYTGPKLPEDESDMQYTRSKSASPDIDEGIRPD